MAKIAWLAGLLLLVSGSALAEPPKVTPGYLERVLQWTTEKGERCSDISSALYGSPQHARLVLRYNDVDCSQVLPQGRTLVMPEKVTVLPVAELRDMAPDVQARPPGGQWANATTGMRFFKNHLVSTFDKARADILFVDRSRIFLAEHTLVVIYGSARESNQSKNAPTVDLNEGELMAGIAALRSAPVTVASSGGEIRTSSKDVVVRRKKERSTVSVFDGSARVTAKGKSVVVPQGQGSAFTTNSSPGAPRPLPPPPQFGPDATLDFALGFGGGATILATWKPVVDAVGYRVELARDAEFSQLLAREEVAADVRAFRAERLPAGIYHVRVRAIDHEDFLGLAAARTISAVVASFSGVQGSLEQGRIRATHYSQLKIEAPEGLEVAEQGREFRACPCLLDLSVTEPNALRFRTPGGGRVTSLPIEYRPLAAQVSARFGTAALGEIDVEFSGFEGLSLDQLVRPRLRVHGAAGVQELPLTLRGKRGSVQVARADFSSPMRVDVVDAQGFLLGATDVHAPVPVRVLVDDQQVGPSAPFFSLSPWADVAPWSFAARPTGSLSLALAVEGGEARALNRFQVRDSFKGLGVDAGFSSPVLFGDQGGVADGAWLGLSFAAFRPRPTLRLGPAFRLGVPLEPGAAWRPELALGLELRRGRLGFSSDLGLRAASTHAGQGVPMEQAYLLVQGSFDVGAHALLYGTLDLHTLAFDDRAAGRAGLTLGAEIGSSVFVGAACRVSPWDSGGGYLSGQISLGVRGP